MKPRSVALTFVASLFFLQSAAKAQSPGKSPFDVIREMSAKIQWIGKTTASRTAYDLAEMQARAEIREMIRADPVADALVAKNSDGVTPLMLSAFLGYSGLVEELLKADRVAASVNESGPGQTTAWIFANFASGQVPWTCRPQILADPFRWVPFFVSQPYYHSREGGSPYAMTRHILEQAGAVADMARANEAWLERCPGSSSEIKAKVRQSSDLLETLQTAAQTDLASYRQRSSELDSAIASATPAPAVKRPVTPPDGVDLPPDFLIRTPSAGLGTVATSLTGWWRAEHLLAGETLFAFEDFPSPHEAIVVVVHKTRTKGYRSARLRMAISENILSGKFGESEFTITLSSNGTPTAVVSNGTRRQAMTLRRDQP